MRDAIKDFLDEVCSHVRFKAMHKDIRAELTGHIEELQKQGMSIENAVAAMGDCSEIGSRLDKQHRPQIEWTLIGLVAFISIIGVVMMFWSNDPRLGSFERHIFWAIIGATFATCCMFFDYTKIKKWATPLYILSVLFIIFGLITGSRINGAMWVRIGSISVSSSLIIVPFILAFVGFMDRFRGERLWGIIKLVFLGTISLFMMLLVPSMANALILLVSYAVLLFIAVWKGHFEGNLRIQKILLYAGSLLFVGLFAILIISSPYRFDRIFSFITHSDPYGMSWQNVQLANLLSNSKWIGNIGAIDGYAPYYFLPDLTIEFALVNVISTFGWVVGIALILSIVALIVRLFIVIRKVKYDFGFYLSTAACVILSVQFIVSVLMNLGLFPITGLSLPFVSYGGSAYISNMALIGVILSVWRRNNIIGTSVKKQREIKTSLFEYADGKLIVNLKNIL